MKSGNTFFYKHKHCESFADHQTLSVGKNLSQNKAMSSYIGVRNKRNEKSVDFSQCLFLKFLF